MEERKKRDWGKIAALLCVLLLAVNLWQGQRLENLERQISEARRKLSAEIGGLESSFYAQAQEADKLVWNWEYTPSLNMEKHRLDVEVSAVLKEWREDTAVELFWFAENGGGEGDSLPLFGGGTGTFTGTLELPLDNPSMEISLYAVIQNGGNQRRESLGYLGDTTSLLPVQLAGYGVSSVDYTQEKDESGTFDLYFCEVNLQGSKGSWTPEVKDAVFRLRRNGDVAEEQTAKFGETIENYTCDPEKGLTTEAGIGDTFTLTFFCRDISGLGYEFTLEQWFISEGGIEQEGTEKIWPNLTWD